MPTRGFVQTERCPCHASSHVGPVGTRKRPARTRRTALVNPAQMTVIVCLERRHDAQTRACPITTRIRPAPTSQIAIVHYALQITYVPTHLCLCLVGLFVVLGFTKKHHVLFFAIELAYLAATRAFVLVDKSSSKFAQNAQIKNTV